MIRLVESGIEAIGRAVSWLGGLMVVATFAVVVLRYGFDVGAIALQESVTYMHALLFLLGISYTLKADAHVRVDILYSRMTPRGRNWVNLIGHVGCMLPTTITILVLSIPYASKSWAILEGSPEVGGIPAVFLLKSMIPLGAGLLLLQACAEIVRCVLDLRTEPNADG